MKTRTLFDTFTKELLTDTVKNLANKINAHCTSISHLFSKSEKKRHHISVNDRYIPPEFIHKCFNFINIETGHEYICPTNKSLFLQINELYNENGSKYLNKLKSGLQLTCVIGDKTFICKEYVNLNNGILTRKSGEELKHKISSTSLERKIKNRIASTIRKKLKTTNKIKKNKTCNLLGCDILFFIGWLEAQFMDGMSWDNKNEWQIDHIIPTNLFDITQESEQLRAFHFSNCRPLWTFDNGSRPKDGSDTINTALEKRIIDYWRELGMNTERPLKLKTE